MAALGIPDSALLSTAVAGRLTVAPSAPLRSSPVGIILGIRDPVSPDCEDEMGGVVGTLKTLRFAGAVDGLCGTREPLPSATENGPASDVTGLLSG